MTSSHQIKTEAIILDTTAVFDADRSYLLYSKELGKLRARARGVRRPSSRLSGHLLAYLPTQLELVEKEGWYLIVQASLLAQPQLYPDDPIFFLGQAGILAEAVNRLFTEQDPHPVIYQALSYTLERLRSNPAKGTLIVAEFLLKALIELGYRPELSVCVVTGERLKEEFLAWSSHLGGVMSKSGYDQARETAFPLEYPQTVVVLRKFSEPEFWAERLHMAEPVGEEVGKVIYHYLQTQIGQPLHSLQRTTR